MSIPNNVLRLSEIVLNRIKSHFQLDIKISNCTIQYDKTNKFLNITTMYTGKNPVYIRVKVEEGSNTEVVQISKVLSAGSINIIAKANMAPLVNKQIKQEIVNPTIDKEITNELTPIKTHITDIVKEEHKPTISNVEEKEEVLVDVSSNEVTQNTDHGSSVNE